MNKRTILIAVAYSIFVMIYKLVIIFGGYQFTKFGFYFSHVLSVFLIFPFIIIAIKQQRDKDNGGQISGKEAFKVGATVVGISVIILSVYTYIEFEWKFRELSVQYYNSEYYLAFLKSIPKIKPEEYPKIISDNIAQLSPFKAVTAKLFSFLIISLGSAFISSVFMKKG